MNSSIVTELVYPKLYALFDTKRRWFVSLHVSLTKINVSVGFVQNIIRILSSILKKQSNILDKQLSEFSARLTSVSCGDYRKEWSTQFIE